ncbi:MAG: hypothetical protein SH868_08605 [Bythopirellula sp.]|nr:hypothetical protein [Bythopirellula sp.]
MIHSLSNCHFPRLVGVAALCCLTGCTGPWSAESKTESLSVSHTSTDSLAAAPPITEQPITPATAIVPPSQPAPPAVVLTTEQEIALNNLVAEVRGTMILDPNAEHKLRGELRNSRQEEWPLVVKQFRSALAYREQLAARESQQAQDFNRVSHTTQFPPLPQPTQPRNTAASDIQQLQSAVAQAATLQSQEVHLASHLPPVAQEPALPAEQPLPLRGTTLANHVAQPQPTAVQQPVQQVSHVSTTPSNWRSQLTATIDAMQRDVKTNPGNTDELQEHMRLRMLLLMAGRESDSLTPIPGASPTEQDYWSKQLFALSTYFDNSRHSDTKQRAAGALIHLDAARAKLAELATLQVRNLAFVDRVDGYGLYEPHESTKFKPGDQVTLYAEVNNFRSESTKEGYRTTLATSYEVVDPQSRRVDGAQFPEVADICKNQRHDFHMQYGVALPTRIYPGEYELRLIITDQLSNKIGQASLPFEIAD